MENDDDRAKFLFSRTCDSFSDLLRESTNANLWWRGQRDTAWSIVPSIFRNSWMKDAETDFATGFRSFATPYISKTPTTAMEWLLWHQHYGLPTRLLDWSTSPLVAAYFAIESGFSGDRAIFALDPAELNKAVEENPGSVEEYVIEDDLDLKELGFSLDHTGEWKMSSQFFAFTPSRIHDRLTRQHGRFVYCGDGQPLEDKFPKFIRKFTVPGNAVLRMRRELERAGVTRELLFGSLESLCSTMVSRAHDEAEQVKAT